LRAAELLEASGAAGGFSVGTPFTAVESVKLGSSEDSIEFDADFSLVIKRMSKKDSTTKLKVTEFEACVVYEALLKQCY